MRFFLITAILTGFVIKTLRCTTAHDQVFSITPKTPEEVDILRNVSSLYKTVLWQPASPHYITANAEVHLFIPAASLKIVRDQLGMHGITHSVLLANTNELIEMQTRNVSSDPRSTTSYYERYHPLEEIQQWINKTVRENSNMAVTYYNKVSDITEMLNKMDIYVLPVMNPDGYKYTWTENRMWRKNRATYPDMSCIGTDLNRNFDANWCTEGSSSDPCDDTYCGAFPESEPEAAAVANFLRSKKDVVKLYLSIHSYSQMLLFPYSCYYHQAPNHKELDELAQEAAMKIRRYYNNQYKYGAGAKTIYLAPGGSDDWAYKLGISYSFTFELQDKGRYGFLLPTQLIPKACNEALTAVKSIALGVIRKIG